MVPPGAGRAPGTGDSKIFPGKKRKGEKSGGKKKEKEKKKVLEKNFKNLNIKKLKFLKKKKKKKKIFPKRGLRRRSPPAPPAKIFPKNNSYLFIIAVCKIFHFRIGFPFFCFPEKWFPAGAPPAAFRLLPANNKKLNK
ncbi:MAG: hypothetical protein IPP27_17885 [Bacteroidetes bacterium]|nr:hypothetical protein [Bacteroidota bacterium]